MGDRKQDETDPSGTDNVTERNPSVPASEEGTGIVPGDESDERPDTHLPASEADTDLLDGKEPAPPQSWPGRGPGSIPPPG